MLRMRACRGEPSRGEGGFSLVEALVALAIAAMLLAAASEIYWHQRAVQVRMAKQRAADRALENAYEDLRFSGPIAPGSFPAPGDPSITISITVLPGTVDGTWRVDLVASYKVQGQPFRRTLIALMRPT
jgi:prepilin-type N-terminal cleavage/methylation domain-containing protein